MICHFFWCCTCCCRIFPFPSRMTPPTDHFERKDFLPVEPQGCLSFLITWLTPDLHRTHGRPSVQECRLRLKRPTPNAARRCPPFKSSIPESFRGSCSYGLFPSGRFASLRFRPKNMAHHIFRLETSFKIFPKLLQKPRRASPFPRNSPAMVLPRYLAWNTLPSALYTEDAVI